ncbi:MAG TPA: beta-galactosidase trimerization domain-containing protein [bacterium]|nr:beta-galactosidase trimerization domain-containing protein [bacterium]HPP09184.1 beta-galactosidase trimerization domain-containing protein [bacterium]
MNWWEKEPLRIIEICDGFDLKKLPVEVLAKTVKKLGGNVQHFHCMELSTKQYGPGLDDRSLYFRTPLAKKQNPDRLGEYLPYAKKYGIRVIVYFNVHWYTVDFGRRHPDWVQIKQDGNPIQEVYGTGTSFCINSPYREWVFQILKDLCSYDIDGIFYDGPIFFSNTCYCEYCQKLFEQQAGNSLPSKSDRNHPLWKKFVEFQAESMERFLEESNNVIKNINPEILFYMNGNSSWPYWPTGRDNHRIIKHTDILGAEGGFLYGDLNQTPIFKPALTGKLLSSQAKGKVAVVFDCAGHKNWSWYLLPETEISILLYETSFSSAQWWVAVFPDDINQPEMKAISEFGNFIKKHPEPFVHTKSAANIALLWPSKSAEQYSGSSVPFTDFTEEIKGQEIGNLLMELYGFYEALVNSKVVFDVIDEHNFDRLYGYELVILPNAACLSKQDCLQIKEYVKKGGNIVANFETSLYDENGNQRNNFELSDVFGVNFAGTIFGPLRHDYVSPVKTKNRLLKNITKKYFPAPEYGINIETTTGKSLIFYCEKLKGRYDHTPEVSQKPMVVVNRYGKGRVIYLAGTFGSTIAKFRFREYFLLVKNFCYHLSKPLVEFENSNHIEVFLRKNEKNMFLYLINQTSGIKRPLSDIQPLEKVKIRMNVDAKDVVALNLGCKIKFKKMPRSIEFVLSYLKNFEILKISI